MKNTKLQKYYPWIVVALLIIGKTRCDGVQNQMRLLEG